MTTPDFFDLSGDYDWNEPSNESYMFSGPGDEDEKDDAEDNDEETHHEDWGEVDPLQDDSPFGDPMDPSGPGSAV
jgi:hypothetical protein